jgi:hypothetical protein
MNPNNEPKQASQKLDNTTYSLLPCMSFDYSDNDKEPAQENKGHP